MWALPSIPPTNRDRVVAFSLFSEVYVTEDAGASWLKIAREFGEISATVWVQAQSSAASLPVRRT